MKRALVTGAAGFVGRHFARYLIADGWDVTGVDLKDPDLSVWGDVRAPFGYYRDDVRAWLDVAQTGEAHRFDLVVHAAAIVGGRATIDGEPLRVASDLAIDSDLFQWAVRARPRRVLYFSSSAAYPVAHQTGFDNYPLAEECIGWEDTDDGAPWVPDQSYGWVKLTGEMLAGLARAEGVPVTVVRPFSGYGSDQDLDYPFPSFIARAVSGANPFTIWGDGRQVRDWIHIDDVVRGAMAVVESGTDLPVNLCTGRATSFDELASLCIAETGRDPQEVEIAHELGAPAGVRYRVGDPSRMLEHYTPRVTLEEGIARAVADS